MKKTIMRLMVSMLIMAGFAHATYNIDPLIKECTLNPLSAACHPQLTVGDTGAKGDKGDTGAAGKDGTDGISQIVYTVDQSIISRFNSEVSLIETEITNKIDREVSIVQAKIDREVRAIQEEINKATVYANDVVAMTQATSAIDFGTASKGSFEMGVGLGYSSSYIGSGTAGALGFKYGTSDNTAIVVKGSRSFERSDTYAVGGGLTIKF